MSFACQSHALGWVNILAVLIMLVISNQPKFEIMRLVPDYCTPFSPITIIYLLQPINF